MSKSVGVDADAEAPDLLLACGGSYRKLLEERVVESRKARIDSSRCIKCLKCLEVCRFEAIEVVDGVPRVEKALCEGCGACSLVCPSKCIELDYVATGIVRVDETKLGLIIASADLEVGGRSTGHLVYRCREVAKSFAQKSGSKHIVIDAAAGIGCAVISAMAGAELAIIVVEPLPPSIQGAKRMVALAKHFGIKSVAIVNKYDLDPEASKRVEKELGIEVVGFVPYDRVVVESYASMEPVIHRHPDHCVSKALIDAFTTVI